MTNFGTFFGSSHWKMVQFHKKFHKKLAWLILRGGSKNCLWRFLKFRFLPILWHPEPKKITFFALRVAMTRHKIGKNQNFKNRHRQFLEPPLRITHANFLWNWTIFQ